jgi:hypothetical protein
MNHFINITLDVSRYIKLFDIINNHLLEFFYIRITPHIRSASLLCLVGMGSMYQLL